MFRYLALAGVLALGLSAAACAPASLSSPDLASLAGAVATTPPALPASPVSPQALADAGLTPAAQKAVTTNIAAVQKAATKLCQFRPLASGVLNVGIALSSTVASYANSGLGQNVRGAATIVCNALSSAPAYAAFGDRRGEIVTAYVSIGRFDRVPVYGVRTH